MKEIQIRKNDAGQRLDRFVGKAVPLLPESLLQKYIRLKRIKRNGKGTKRDVRLVEGDVLQLYINDEFFEKPTEHNAWLKIATPRLDIVYEDENILLADKKPGVLCHSAGEWSWDTLISNIQAYLRQNGQWDPKAENAFTPALCNRIDRNTGGIVIAAKNAEALRILNDKIRGREIEKSYLCVVCGRPRPAEGRLEGYLFKDAVKNQVYVTKKAAARRQDRCDGIPHAAKPPGALARRVPAADRPHAPDPRTDGRRRLPPARRREVRPRAHQPHLRRDGADALFLQAHVHAADGRGYPGIPARADVSVPQVAFAEKYFPGFTLPDAKPTPDENAPHSGQRFDFNAANLFVSSELR